MSFLLNTCDVEYRKDPKIRKEDVQQLFKWVEKQAHMPKVSEYILIQILHVCDYSIRRAEELVETYYEFRNTSPEIFHDNDAMLTPCSCDYWSTLYSFIIPRTTPDGHRIIYFSLRQTDPALYNNEVTLRMWVRVLLTIILEEGTCPGYSLIYDLKGYSFSHWAGFSVFTMKNYIQFSQDAIPLRVKSVHIINGHGVVTKLDAIIKPFVKKEVKEMVHIHSNLEDFYKDIGREYLPSDIGGYLKETREELNEIMRAKVTALAPMVEEEINLKIDESKRLTKKSVNLSRMDRGTFRKLELD